MHDEMLTDALEALLADCATPKAVRAIEAGGSSQTLWQAIEASGFCDALVPEAQDGAGLGLSDVFTLFEACGRHALPVPFGETVMARALIALDGEPAPAGAIALATRSSPEGPIEVLHGRDADWVLVDDGRSLRLLDAHAASREAHAGLPTDARVQWPDGMRPERTLRTNHDLRVIQAVVLAAQMSGSMREVFARTLEYANEREQFGRSIGKFQAVQHQLSVMAEHMEAARMAARMACASRGALPEPLLAAMAKARTSEAVVPVAAIAHAVHGAIGITAEYDLQLHTRRLHAWRVTAGSESYWQQRIGRALFDGTQSVPDFVRSALSPAS